METSPMETTTKFLFRDHQDMDNSSVSGAGTDVSSVPSHHDEDDVDGPDDDFQSMTAMGIRHLCSELMELKEESDEDFYRYIFSNYSAFIRILEDAGVMEQEINQLKNHISDQRKLVDDLVDGIHEKLLMDEVTEPQRNECAEAEEPVDPSRLDAHAVEILETLDVLLVENRIEEALDVLEQEKENLRRMEEENDNLLDTFSSIKSLISEKEATLALQLTLLAENPRISASELQITLASLTRLGNKSLANQLLFKYYHKRIAAGTRRLESSSLSFDDGIFIRDLSKLVFSLISQATKGFEMLHGEDSANTEELNQWAKAETKEFTDFFITYVMSISEINGGLSTVVHCAEVALSFCSLLERQKVELRNCLVDGIRPCMEEVLQVHIEHFKKVVRIFTASDGWILGKYLTSGILASGHPTVWDGECPECCYLTNSGRKLVTLLQAITEDVSPLLVLRMQASIIKGLEDLYMEYVAMSREAVSCDLSHNIENKDPKFSSTEMFTQQVSILANISTLEGLFCRMLRTYFHGNLIDGPGSCLSNVVQAAKLLRSCFCQGFISKIMSSQIDQLCSLRICNDERGSTRCGGLLPSVPFQVLFLELRKIEQLSEEEFFKKSWLLELLRELIKDVFVWLQDMRTTSDDCVQSLTAEYQENPEQFMTDLQFLAEIAKHGGYFSDDPSVLESLTNSASLPAEPDLQRVLVNDEQGTDAAVVAIKRLLELAEEEEGKDVLPTQGPSDWIVEGNGGTDESPLENMATSNTNESTIITEDAMDELGVGDDIDTPNERYGVDDQ